MKTLNQLICDYTRHLQRGEIQLAYKGVLDFVGKLRADFIRKYPHYGTGSIYQGYMDMSYFPVSTRALRDKGLKIALVYLQEKGQFEAWLSARNRDIARGYLSVLNEKMPGDIDLFHDENNPDAITECLLASAPNFDDQAALTDLIERGAEKFIEAVSDLVAG